MIVTSVQIKTAKTQKHLYCLVFTYRCGRRIVRSDFFIFTSLAQPEQVRYDRDTDIFILEEKL